MMHLLVSEQLKLRTLRSTWYVLGSIAVIVGLCTVIGWNTASRWESLAAHQRAVFGFTPLVSLAASVGSLCLAVFGVLAITSEYASGAIQVTFTIVPRRRRVLVAKAVVVAAVAAVCGCAVSAGALFASRLVETSVPVSSDLPLALASGLSVVMFSMIGLGCGALLKSTTAAIAVPVGLLYLLPALVQGLQLPWNEWVGSLAPSALATQLAGQGATDHFRLSPLTALGLMGLYAGGPLGLAMIWINQRDA